MRYEIDGLLTVFAERTANCMLGKLRYRVLNWMPADTNVITPSIVVATVVLVEIRPHDWILSHILIDDDVRRKGWGEKIVTAIQREHGDVGAAWCTDEGMAFARRFIAKHGPQPKWKIESCEDAARRRAMRGVA